jgi:L-ascorbate metabolism protein UlaG (beta-lactamase superfamily)
MTVEITWYDNAAFRVATGTQVYWFDPSLNKNADSPIKTTDIKETAQYVFTTHGDPGHFVNSAEVTTRTNARFVGSRELCAFLAQRGALPPEQLIPLEFDKVTKLDGVEVFLFEAPHPTLTPELLASMARWGGAVESRNGGLVVRTQGFCLCLLGDCLYSGIFHEVAKRYRVDVGMIPVQGKMHVDSSPEEAAENGARIAAALRPTVLFPVIQYSREKVRIPPLRRKLGELGVTTRLIFDRPGVLHTFAEF